MSGSDSEPDYDDPRFLDPASTSSASASFGAQDLDLTYAERRKRTLAAQAERGRNKSRKQVEEETRDAGLSTNLIAREQRRDEAGEGASTAFKMMSKMGYKPGEALGRKYDSPPAALDETAPPHRTGGGLGFAKASFAPVAADTSSSTPEATPPPPPPAATGSGPTGEAKTEPIRFEMRTGRTGLGIPQAKRFRTYMSSSTSHDPSSSAFDASSSASDPLPDLQGYLARIKSSMDERRAYGLLRSLRRTCEELDRRAGIEDSPMWRDPEEEERERVRVRNRKLFDRIDTELASDDDDGGGGPGGAQQARAGESFGTTAAAAAAARDGKVGRGELSYAIGLSDTVVDGPDDPPSPAVAAPVSTSTSAAAVRGDPDAEAEEEETEWFSFDIRSRLALTLTYLRNKYHYCFWCGELYRDAQDLEEHCPGTEEEDH